MLQEALKVASIEGEFFTAEVIARVQEIDEQQIVNQLSNVLDKQHRLVRVQDTQRLDPDGQRLSHYRFRHFLFQKYLYNSLDKAERVYLHEAVGNALEHLYEHHIDEVAIQLARHFQAAGLATRAIGYLQKAGEQAIRSYANDEAIALFNEALALLKSLPDNLEGIQQELSLQIALANTLMATKGYAAVEVEQAFARARELCQQVGETLSLFPVLQGLYRFYLIRGEMQITQTLAEQSLRLIEGQQDPILLVPAHLVSGLSLWYTGAFALAQVHFEQVLTLYTPEQHHAYILRYGQDPGVACLSYLALALWHLGYSDQALQRSQEAHALVQRLPRPFDLAYVLNCTTWLHQLRREVQATLEWAERAVTLAAEHDLTFWAAMGTILRGWALIEQGNDETGIAQIRQGLETWRAIGAELIVPYYLTLLVKAYQKVGRVAEALNIVAEALIIVDKTEQRFPEAELYRLRGELLLQAEVTALQPQLEPRLEQTQDEAEDCFWQAIEIARRQQAKLLELRATVSLCRLWQRQGRTEEARQMLVEIYTWFTEGFETVDLKEAKVLLEELS
jgi:predicted ATPase